MPAEPSARALEAWDGPYMGVICSFDFDAGGVRPLAEPRLSTAATSAWSWTHVRLGDVRTLALLRTVEGLPAEALELFASGESRIQIGEEAGWMFGVLPDLERDLSGQPQG